MAIRDRINAVVQDWCGTAAPQDQNLQQLWQATRTNPQRPHPGMQFQPDGADSLIDKLAAAFTNVGPDSRRIVMHPGDFEPSGAVKTMDDLVTAVVFSPPPSTAGGGV